MNKKFYLYEVISLLIISVFFCSCSKVKNEPVKVIQTGSFSNALVIQVNKIGKYSVYIPKDITKSKDLKLKIEADRNAEYLPIKNLMRCLQDAGYTQYNLTTKP